ncbi:MAG TPA: hypothetical protein VLA19_01040, partial [Herpetosiphonaceae bacterium]|nr:hypothetical protein [Herpetosiphonaceae bacterium]
MGIEPIAFCQACVPVVAVRPSNVDAYAYDFGDTGKLTPLVKMHTLGGIVAEVWAGTMVQFIQETGVDDA